MSTNREHRVVREGLSLSVSERGPKDAPSILLVHGYPDTKEVWDLVADRLAERYHVVAYDVRGAGASDVPSSTSGFRLEHLIADLAAVANATSPDRPIHLVGHDWGSIQSWSALVSDSLAERIASYTAISGPSLDHVGGWIRARMGGRPKALRELVAQALRSWYVYAFHAPLLAPLVWKAGLAGVWAALLGATEGAVSDARWPAATLTRDAMRGVRLYRANVLARVFRPRPRATDVPVQLLIPTRDPFVSASLARGATSWASDIRCRSVQGGHWVLRSRPDRVAGLIDEHVMRVEAGMKRAEDDGPGSKGRARASRRVEGPAGDGGEGERRKLVVVTGGGSGIGRATCLAFADRHAEIVLCDLDLPSAERTAELCRLVGAQARAYAVNVGDASQMEAFARTVAERHGVPSVVVNNAGIGMAGPILDTTVDEWRRILDVNLWGVIHGSRLFGARMVERGEGGHIVNVASAAAFTPSRILGAYATTKAAVLMFTECLRAELATAGIGVSAICPGIVNTGIVQATRFVGASEADQARRRDRTDRLYRRRGFTPERVAKAIVRAVDRNSPVVPVAFEANALRALGRFAPGVARRLARFDLTPR